MMYFIASAYFPNIAYLEVSGTLLDIDYYLEIYLVQVHIIGGHFTFYSSCACAVQVCATNKEPTLEKCNLNWFQQMFPQNMVPIYLKLTESLFLKIERYRLHTSDFTFLIFSIHSPRMTSKGLSASRVMMLSTF